MKLSYTIFLTCLVSGAVLVNGQEDFRALLKRRFRDHSGVYKRHEYNSLAARDILNSPEFEASMVGKTADEVAAAHQFVMSRAKIADDRDRNLPDSEALKKASKSVVGMKKFLLEKVKPELVYQAKERRVHGKNPNSEKQQDSVDSPPADGPPADGPPADGPPADGPPADGPPADGPPADGPPADGPPADNPPADSPPADNSPVDNPPADNPPADSPPADNPPADNPPADNPPADNPPADSPPADGSQPENKF